MDKGASSNGWINDILFNVVIDGEDLVNEFDDEDDSDCHSDCQGSQKESGSVPESNIADAEKPQ